MTSFYFNYFLKGLCLQIHSEVLGDEAFNLRIWGEHKSTPNSDCFGKQFGSFLKYLKAGLPSMRAKSLQLCLTLCNSMDRSPPGSSVHRILQARILEWVACPPPGDLPDPGIKSASLTFLALAGRFFTTSTTWEAQVTIGPRNSTPRYIPKRTESISMSTQKLVTQVIHECSQQHSSQEAKSRITQISING